VLRLLADENFDGRILRALWRQIPNLDVVRTQDTAFAGVEDPTLLEAAATEGRVLLTHDVNTIVDFAWDRVRLGKAMAGVIVASTSHPLGQVIEDLVVLLLASRPDELEGQVRFLPL